MTILNEQFDKTVEKYSEHTALIFFDEKIEYGRLQEAIKRLAQGLLNIGIEETNRVALLLPNIPHLPISYYAILEIGAIVVPLNIMLSAEELAEYLNDSDARALITWEGFRPQVMKAVEKLESLKNVIFLGKTIPAGSTSLQRLIAESKPIEKSIESNPDTTAAIVYTTGIADIPVGVEMSHRNLSSSAMTCRDMFMINSDERVIHRLDTNIRSSKLRSSVITSAEPVMLCLKSNSIP